jgi:exoribonuclease-2
MQSPFTTSHGAAPATHRSTLTAVAHRAMLEQGLEPDFPAAALHELATLTKPAAAPPGLRDLRDRLWASIDNDDSRDLDQLTVAEPLANGQVRILVAVADVDALVHQGTAIDTHAARNTTSVYTPAVIFPMLPVVLSTDLTSLGENQDRLALVADLVFAADGSPVSSELYRAQAHNQAKLAYNSVGAWLEGKSAAPQRINQVPGLADNLRLQDIAAQRLAARRRQRGSLSLETDQNNAVFTGDTLSHLEPAHTNRATQLIEEFMIAANEAAAKFLASRKFPTIRRALRSPERWARIVQLAAGLGERLPATADGLALEGFLLHRHQVAPEKFADLSLSVVKLIGRGEYVLDLPDGTPPGHFGLALKDYTHSTAPNRRFPDLLTQRLLKAALAGTPLPYTIPQLSDLANRCTEQEANATKVERQVQKSAAALLLANQIGRHFNAVVTGASVKGTWVRILQPPVEGKLTEGFAGLHVGDHLSVKLIHTDYERGFIDFVRD